MDGRGSHVGGRAWTSKARLGSPNIWGSITSQIAEDLLKSWCFEMFWDSSGVGRGFLDCSK